MKNLAGSALVLAACLAAGVARADPDKPAPRVTMNARFLRVKTKPFLDALCGNDSASVRTVFDRDGLERLTLALAKAVEVKSGTKEGAFSELLKLEAFDEKEYVYGADVQDGAGGVPAQPVLGQARWGMQLQFTPVSIDAAGRIIAYADCIFSALLGSEFAVVSRVKIELPHAIDGHLVTRVAIPPGGAVIFGNSVPGDPEETFVIEVRAESTGGAVGDPASALACGSMTSLLLVQAKGEPARVSRDAATGELSPAEAGKARKAGKVWQVCFFPFDAASAGEYRSDEPDRFVQNYAEAQTIGKKEWEPVIGSLEARVELRTMPKGATGAGEFVAKCTVHLPKWPLRTRKHAASGRTLTDPEFVEGKSEENAVAGNGGPKAYFWEIKAAGGGYLASWVLSME